MEARALLVVHEGARQLGRAHAVVLAVLCVELDGTVGQTEDELLVPLPEETEIHDVGVEAPRELHPELPRTLR